MPTEARVHASIWRDPDFIALPEGPQRMYLFLLSQLDTSMCGRLLMRETGWAAKAAGLDAAAVRERLDALAAARFVIIDDDTQELLVRSRIRRDEVLKGPKLIAPLTRACREVESGLLRSALAAELRRCLAEDLVHPRSVNAVHALAAEMEHSSGYTTGSLFSQVDTLSEISGYPIAEDADRARGKGGSFRSNRSVDNGTLDVGGGVGGEIELRRPKVLKAALGTDDDPGFAKFWETYPRKTGKGAARTAWAKAAGGGADPEELIAAAARLRDLPGREARYTPHPATWLNQERWHDEPETGISPQRGESGVSLALRNIGRTAGLRPFGAEEGTAHGT